METKMAHTCLLLLLLPAFLTFTSSNQLTGELPESLQSSAYEDSFLGNCGLCAAANLTVSIPACRYSSHNQMSAGLIILLASVLAGAILIGAVGCFIVRRKKLQDRDVASWKMMPFRKLDFSECDVLTNLREEDVIGRGGSGKVYRVHLPGRGHGRGCGGTVVAVKKLWSRGKAEEKLDREFDTEVKMLGDIRHNNIVSLLCYISSEDTKLLVYEYMENGSLDRWLHPKDNAATAALDWPTRLGIAIDAARGLSYMHDECAQPIMHRDIKSSNILLDPGLHAKIADFGLARILLKSESVSGVGSMAAPEEFFGEEANQKADVYGFGMVLLELATGRAENDLVELAWPWRHHKPGGPPHDVVDKRIHDRALYLEDAVAVFQLGVMCTGDDPQSRPSMGHVLQQLITISGTGTTTRHQAAA